MALTLDQSANLMTNTTFQGRIKTSSMIFATSITQNPGFSSGLQSWARTTIAGPMAMAAQLQPSVTIDSAVQNAGIDPDDGDSLVTDDQLNQVVQVVVQRLFS